MKRLICLVVLSALALSGCVRAAQLIPPSKEKTREERLTDENAQLRERLQAEEEVNHRLAYQLEKARIELERARAAAVSARAAADRAAREALPEPAFEDFQIERVRLGLLTGPSNWDGKPGLDGFKVYLIAEDSEGTTLKRKGNCSFDLVDLSQGEEVIMSWALPAEDLGDRWQALPPGFRVTLPWKGEVPWGDDVALRAKFTDAWGREFTAARVFTLKREEHGGREEKPAAPEQTGEVSRE